MTTEPISKEQRVVAEETFKAIVLAGGTVRLDRVDYDFDFIMSHNTRLARANRLMATECAKQMEAASHEARLAIEDALNQKAIEVVSEHYLSELQRARLV